MSVMCEKNDCQFRHHLEILIEIAEAMPNDQKAVLNGALALCTNPETDSGKCRFAETKCCAKYPDCATVLSRRTMFKNDLVRLSLNTCTDLGAGRCMDMLVKDSHLIMEGKGDEITVAKPIREKFDNLKE